MRKLFTIFAFSLAITTASAQELNLYLDAAFGVDTTRSDSNALFNQRNMGQATLGLQGEHFFIELQHISDVQQADAGLNMVWVGARFNLLQLGSARSGMGSK